MSSSPPPPARFIALAAAALAVAAALWWLTRTPGPPPAQHPVAATVTAPAGLFTDVTSSAGLGGSPAGTSRDAADGHGAALIDADHDGDLDIVAIRGRAAPGAPPAAASSVQLYINDGQGRFADHTAAAALDVRLEAVAVAGGDFDNDGWADLFLTGRNGQVLLENVGGRFHDITAAAGVTARPGQGSTCALWFDADADGDLDLVVCASGPGGSSYLLYANQGDGRFVEHARQAGLVPAVASAAAAASVVLAYLAGDACPDLVMTRDTALQAFRNSCTGTFTELSAPSDVALDGIGGPAAGGLDVATDDDGRPLFASAVHFDYDLDGRVDRLTVDARAGRDDGPGPAALLHWNTGQGGADRYAPVADAGALALFGAPRGAAYGDIDGDGDLDLLITPADGSLRLLRNDVTGARSFRLRLVGTASPRDGTGAIVEVTAAGRTRRRVVTAARGYRSQSELPLTFGVGDGDPADLTIRITWPSGAVQSLSGVPLEQTTTITEVS